MDRRRKIMRVGVVIALALGSGHLVQNTHKHHPEPGLRSAAGLIGVQPVSASSEPQIHYRNTEIARPAAPHGSSPFDPG